MRPRVFHIILDTPEGRRWIDCSENEFIWNAAARTGIHLPAICQQGRCVSCAARLVRGDVDQSAAVSYYDEDRKAGFVLLCTAKPRSDLLLQTHQEWVMREHRRAHGLPAPYS